MRSAMFFVVAIAIGMTMENAKYLKRLKVKGRYQMGIEVVKIIGTVISVITGFIAVWNFMIKPMQL